MSLVTLATTVLAEGEGHHIVNELPFPAIWFGVIAAVVFIALGFVTWSYRDVANRHAHKTANAQPHGAEHGHGGGH